MDEILPSTWGGNYTCEYDDIMRGFTMNFVKSAISIIVNGDIHIDMFTMNITGTFATFLKQLTLQSSGLGLREIFGRNFTKVEINGYFNSSVWITGFIILHDNNQVALTCPVELRRTAGKLYWYKFKPQLTYINCRHF